MRVPDYTQRVERVAPTTQVPAMPSISFPGVIPAAFDGGVGEATENLGKGLQILAKHVEQRVMDRQDQEVLDREAAFRQEMQGVLFNNETETVTIGGKEITRPKGILLRQLEHARGSTNDLVETYHKIREKYVDGISYYQATKLVPAIKSYFASIRERVAISEANQWQESEKNSVEAYKSQAYLDASTIRTGEELNKTIDKTQSAVAWYNGQFDPATQKIKNEEIAEKISESAFNSAILNSIDLSQTKLFLEEVKDKIPQATYDKISQDIEKTQKENADKIRRIRAENAQLANLAIDKAEDNLVTKKINNQLTVADVKESLYQGTIRPKFADSLIKSLISLKTVDAKTDPATYSDMVDLILSPNRKASEVREELLNAYNEGNLNETDFKHLYSTKMIPGQTGRFSVAEEYSDEMAKANEPPRLGFIRTAVEMLKTFAKVDNTTNSLIAAVPLIKKLFNRIEAGKTPDNQIQEVAKELVKEKVKSDNPIIGFLDDIPNLIATKGAIKSAYPGSTKLKPDSNYKGELDVQEKYEVGDTVTHNSKEYVVVDFDTDGEPLLEETENAR